MTEKSIQTSIKSYKARMEAADQTAIEAIRGGMYETAASMVARAAGYKAAIEELEFILEAMEVWHD